MAEIHIDPRDITVSTFNGAASDDVQTLPDAYSLRGWRQNKFTVGDILDKGASRVSAKSVHADEMVKALANIATMRGKRKNWCPSIDGKDAPEQGYDEEMSVAALFAETSHISDKQLVAALETLGMTMPDADGEHADKTWIKVAIAYLRPKSPIGMVKAAMVCECKHRLEACAPVADPDLDHVQTESTST